MFLNRQKSNIAKRKLIYLLAPCGPGEYWLLASEYNPNSASLVTVVGLEKESEGRPAIAN